ncbi:MAG: hypothetical protein OXE40_03740 [Gammaproteobacteria bacterium]|nr:hypothetical protein [Gammaproteobacteria bacterium]
MAAFNNFIGGREKLSVRGSGVTVQEQAYLDLREMARQADRDGDILNCRKIWNALVECGKRTNEKFQALNEKYGKGVTPSTGAKRRMRGAFPPQAVAAANLLTVREIEQFDWVAEYRQALSLSRYYHRQDAQETHYDFLSACNRIGGLVKYRCNELDISIEGPFLWESGAPNLTEQRYRAIVDTARRAADSNQHKLAEACKQAWLSLHRSTIRVLTPLRVKYGPLETLAQGVERSKQREPVTIVSPAAGRRPSDPTVQPPAIGAGYSGGATGTRSSAPHLGDDDFAVERALLAGKLPPGFDASLLVAEANVGEEDWLVDELEARRLPTQTIDSLLARYEATDEGGANTPFIEYLRSVKENVERALRAAYPGRAEPEWLARGQVQLLPRVERAEGLVATVPLPPAPPTTQ